MFTVSSSKNGKKDGGNGKENTPDGKENRKKKKSGKSVSRQSDSSKKGRRTGMQVYSSHCQKYMCINRFLIKVTTVTFDFFCSLCLWS